MSKHSWRSWRRRVTFVEERLRQIESTYAHLIRNFLVLQLTEETFRLVLSLSDGTNLRVAERWRGVAGCV